MRSKLAFLYFLFFGQLCAQTQLGSDIDGEAASNFFGQSVSISSNGNRMAIGAINNNGNGNQSGHVRLFEWDGTLWNQVGMDIDGEAAQDHFGASVSLSANGNRVAIGAADNDGNGTRSGHVRMYEWSGASWNQVGNDIDGEAANDYSGEAISLSTDGNRVAIGAAGNDGNGNLSGGHVRLFDWDGISWNQVGNDIDGEDASDHSGSSVSLSSNGNRVAIGARYADGINGVNSGHVRFYDWNGSVWTQVGSDIDGKTASDYLGWSVSLSASGNRAAIGAPAYDGIGSNSGQVSLYEWTGSTWNQVGNDMNGEGTNDKFGETVSLSANGNQMAIGSQNNDGNGNNSGHVRLFDWNGISWNQIGSDIDGESAFDHFGISVSLSANGDRVAIGAPANAGNGPYSGHVRVFDTLNNSCFGMDSVVAVNANSGVYRAYFDTLAGSSWMLEYKSIQDVVWRSKTINRSLQKSQKFNITPSFGTEVLVRIVSQDSTGTSVGCEIIIQVPCKQQNLNIITQIEAFCIGDSVLLRAGYSGGYKTPSFQWSNGANTKRTYANQGDKLIVTVTDLAGCSVTDSITVPILNTVGSPTDFMLSKDNATTFTGSWTAASLSSGASLIGYRMAYRQVNVGASWTTTALSTNTSSTVDFTGSGNISANYEFTVFARMNDNGSVYNSEYACKERKFYNGSGSKSDGQSLDENGNTIISIYPNPTNNKVYVQAQLGAKIQLFDLHGKLLSQKEALSNETAFDLSAYANGVYLMKISTNDQVIAKQVMKN